MPRKPKLGPAIIKLERLTDGVDPRIVDEQTGKVLHQPRAKPPKIDNAQVYMDAQSRKRVDTALRMLKAVGIVKAVQEPKLGANQCRLGQAVMTLPRKPFRRV